MTGRASRRRRRRHFAVLGVDGTARLRASRPRGRDQCARLAAGQPDPGERRPGRRRQALGLGLGQHVTTATRARLGGAPRVATGWDAHPGLRGGQGAYLPRLRHHRTPPFAPAPKTITALAWHPKGGCVASAILGECACGIATISGPRKNMPMETGSTRSPVAGWTVARLRQPGSKRSPVDARGRRGAADERLRRKGAPPLVRPLEPLARDERGSGRLHLGLLGAGPEGREPAMFPHDAPVSAVAFQMARDFWPRLPRTARSCSGAPSAGSRSAPRCGCPRRRPASPGLRTIGSWRSARRTASSTSQMRAVKNSVACICVCLGMLASGSGHAAPTTTPALIQGSLRIAAAANLVYVVDALNAEFRKSAQDVAVTNVVGTPRAAWLRKSKTERRTMCSCRQTSISRENCPRLGEAVPSSLLTFARGRLVFWTVKPSVPMTSVEQAIRSLQVARIAIANPELAPYGRAALDVSTKLGLSAEAGPKLVFAVQKRGGDRAIHRIGNADAGFVPLSRDVPGSKHRGTWILIAEDQHRALEEGAIITGHGSGNPAAWQFLGFLRSPQARKILEDSGYRVPASP